MSDNYDQHVNNAGGNGGRFITKRSVEISAGIYADAVVLVDESGNPVADAPVSTAAITSVNSSASTGQLLAANAARKGVVIVNTDANALYIKYGTTATAAGGGYTTIIPASGYWEMPLPIYTGRIDGIWAADGAGLAEITEL